MNITTSQIFQIGAAVITFSIALGSTFLDPKLVATIGGALGTLWTTIGAILTNQAAQIKEVAALPGVTQIQTNAQANATLQAVANDPNQPKVV